MAKLIKNQNLNNTREKPLILVEEQLMEYQVVERSIAGIPVQQLSKVSDKYAISISDWAEIMGISTKSIQRYQQQENILSATQTEFVLKIEQLYHIGKGFWKY